MSALQIMMTKAEAERITSRIRLLVDTIAANTEKVFSLIEQAQAGEAWRVLQYSSWTAYVAAEFSGSLKALEKADRIPVVAKLSQTGMSTRAIGSVVGASKDTVARDLQAGVSCETPAADLAFACTDGVTRDHCFHSPVCPQVHEKVVGTDGKTYPRKATFLPSGKPDARSTREMGESVPPPARKARRRPLPDAYWTAMYDLEKIVERLERLHADDRFVGHQPELAARNQNRLQQAHIRLAELGRHLVGTDSEPGEWSKRGRAKYFPVGDPDD